MVVFLLSVDLGSEDGNVLTSGFYCRLSVDAKVSNRSLVYTWDLQGLLYPDFGL